MWEKKKKIDYSHYAVKQMGFRKRLFSNKPSNGNTHTAYVSATSQACNTSLSYNKPLFLIDDFLFFVDIGSAKSVQKYLITVVAG